MRASEPGGYETRRCGPVVASPSEELSVANPVKQRGAGRQLPEETGYEGQCGAEPRAVRATHMVPDTFSLLIGPTRKPQCPAASCTRAL